MRIKNDLSTKIFYFLVIKHIFFFNGIYKGLKTYFCKEKINIFKSIKKSYARIQMYFILKVLYDLISLISLIIFCCDLIEGWFSFSSLFRLFELLLGNFEMSQDWRQVFWLWFNEIKNSLTVVLCDVLGLNWSKIAAIIIFDIDIRLVSLLVARPHFSIAATFFPNLWLLPLIGND